MGAPLEIAFIYPSPDLGAGELRYRMDRSDEWCRKPPTRQPWRREGRTIWLYAEDGIARGIAGNPRSDAGPDGRSTECYVDAEVRDVHSRRRYLFAAPHGHARLLPKSQLEIKSGECRGEVPVAYVVRKGELDEETLVAWCRGKMASFKVPRRVMFLERLPRTALGKVQKSLLRITNHGDTENTENAPSLE